MGGELRIATFNLENLDDSPGAAVPLEARLRVLRPQLERLEADVLCLQEINAARHEGRRRLTALDRLLEDGPYAGCYRAVSLSESGRGAADRHNLAIVSRWPIRRWHSLRHELVPPPELAGVAESWDRPLLWAELELPGGRPLTLLDLHLRAPRPVPARGPWAEGRFRAAVRRLGQALEARLLVEQRLEADPDALLAVCGDCNAGPDDETLALLEGREDWTAGDPAGDQAAALPAARRLVALSRSLPADRRFSLLHGGRRLLFDHILASRPLYGLFRALEIHNELLDETAEGDAGSGHAPLVARFQLP